MRDCLSPDLGLAFVLGGKDSIILCASSRKSLSSRKEAHTYTPIRQIGLFEIIVGHTWTIDYHKIIGVVKSISSLHSTSLLSLTNGWTIHSIKLVSVQATPNGVWIHTIRVNTLSNVPGAAVCGGLGVVRGVLRRPDVTLDSRFDRPRREE